MRGKVNQRALREAHPSSRNTAYSLEHNVEDLLCYKLSPDVKWSCSVKGNVSCEL